MGASVHKNTSAREKYKPLVQNEIYCSEITREKYKTLALNETTYCKIGRRLNIPSSCKTKNYLFYNGVVQLATLLSAKFKVICSNSNCLIFSVIIFSANNFTCADRQTDIQTDRHTDINWVPKTSLSMQPNDYRYAAKIFC